MRTGVGTDVEGLELLHPNQSLGQRGQLLDPAAKETQSPESMHLLKRRQSLEVVVIRIQSAHVGCQLWKVCRQGCQLAARQLQVDQIVKLERSCDTGCRSQSSVRKSTRESVSREEESFGVSELVSWPNQSSYSLHSKTEILKLGQRF